MAQAYQALGYSVTSNVNLAGQQVDVVCERHMAGAGRLKLYVECKYSAPGNPSISKDEITQFVSNFHAVKARHAFTIGVMVSNQPFSQYAQAAVANHPDILLRTLDALQTEAFGVHPYLQSVLDRYSDDGGFFDYVELNASRDADKPEPAHALFEAWLADDGAPQLYLLGDFGAGKSTLFQRMQCHLARRYLDGQFNRMPLLLPLREVGMADDGHEVIERFFAKHIGTSVPYDRFERFNADGRFVLLLDGFDEMAAASDRAARHKNYIKLCQLVAPRAKVAISCRPAYFISETELRNVFDYWDAQVAYSKVNRPNARRTLKRSQLAQYLVGQEGSQAYRERASLVKRSFTNYLIRLELFDREQIKEYLAHHRAHIGKASSGQLDDVSLIERIETIYDLEDLAHRPILLKLIVESLPKFRKSEAGGYTVSLGAEDLPTKTITPSLLYFVYTEDELTREYKKGQSRWRIDRNGRRRVIAKLAYNLLRREKSTIAADDLTDLVVQELGVERADAEEVTTDIRSTSFLVRELNGDVRFSHKSFMEYFSAEHIRTLMGGINFTKKALSTHRFSDEVLYFLGDILATTEPLLLRQCVKLCDSFRNNGEESATIRQNAENILNFARRPSESMRDLVCARLSYLKLTLNLLTYEDTKIAEIDIKRTSIGHWRCGRATLLRVRIHESPYVKATFERRSHAALEWRQATGSVSFSVATGSIVLNHGAKVSLAAVDSRLHIKTEADGIFEDLECDGSIVVGDKMELALAPRDTKSLLTNSVFIHVHLSGLLRQGVEITNCLSIGCSIGSVDDLRLLRGMEGYVVLRDREKYRERVGERLMVFGNGNIEQIAKLAGQTKSDLSRYEWEELLVMGFPRDGASLDHLTPKEGQRLWRMSREEWIDHLKKTSASPKTGDVPPRK